MVAWIIWICLLVMMGAPGYWLGRTLKVKKRMPVLFGIGGTLLIGGLALGLTATNKLTQLEAQLNWDETLALVIDSRLNGPDKEWVSREDGVIEMPAGTLEPLTEEETILVQGKGANRLGSKNFRPLIFYNYDYEGTTHLGGSTVKVPGFGGSLNRWDVAREELARYPIGATITVHVNPDNPAESVVKPGPTWDIFGHQGLSAVLIAAALGLFVAGAGSATTSRD